MGSAWKVAYADFVTALMAFFLLMWVLNMTPPETKAGLAEYFALEGTADTNATARISNNAFINSTDKLDLRDIKISEVEKSHYAIAQKLKQMLMADAIPQDASGISADDVGVQLRVNSDAFFKPGSSELSAAGQKVMADVLSVLGEYNLYALVRGHADSAEAQNSIYPSAWELSAARAASAARYLSDHDISPTRLRAVAYGDTRPLEPGDTPESQAKNRRVEFYFHRPEVMNYSIVY